jgi:glyoxylase-like metal-dependent hydrolase (beta-lactamase superfamily II)
MEISTADSWYVTTPLGDDVTLITEPYIKAFYRCNIWHVGGRVKDLLIDTGMGVVSLRQHVPAINQKPCVAVASHTHFDHVGSHYEFDERWVHASEADILAAPTRATTLADPYVSDEIFTRLPPTPYCSAEYQVKSAPATRLLADGDGIDLGNRRFEVIHTPGHSPGSIMLWEQESRVLFSGDTVYDGPLIDDAYHSDIDAYVASMERILDLPVRVVHGGHFPSFDGARYRAIVHSYIECISG